MKYLRTIACDSQYQLKLRDYLYRYASFTLAKVALLFGRSAILILCYKWLPTHQFGVIAGALSVVEIVRAFSDFGAESIVYSRLSSAHSRLPNIVKKIIQLRLTVSILSVVSLVLLSFFLNKFNLWPLFLIPLTGSIQNSSFAFLQKNKRFQQILYLVVLISFMALCTVFFVLTSKPIDLSLLILMVLPEFVAALIALMFTMRYWRSVMLYRANSRRFLVRLSPYIFPSMMVSVLVMFYSRMDVMLVYPLLGAVSQAQYSLSIRVVEPIFMILSLGSLAFLAELGSYNSRGAKVLAEKFVTFFKGGSYFFIFLLSILLALVARTIASGLLSLDDKVSWIVFFLAFAIPIKLCNSLLSTSLQRFGHYYIVMKAAVGVFLSTYILSLVFGWWLGLFGVVLATNFSEVLNFLYQKNKLNAVMKDS